MIRAALLLVPAVLAAQARPPGAPLDPVAAYDIPVMPVPVLPALFEPAPVVGLFRTLGLAAGLADDILLARASVRAALRGEGGAFRRPFDPDDVAARGAEAGGWRRLTERRAVWGRAAVEDAGFGRAGPVAFLGPYTSSPLVIADTTSPRLRRARALLEGAIGWRFGGLRLGLAAGLDVREDATRDARFIRSVRHAVPAVQASVGHALPAGLVFAVRGKWSGGTETAIYRPEPGASRAYLFDGFDDPFPLDLIPPNAYLRRNQRDAYTAGGALTGPLAGGRFVVGWSRTYRTDRHFSLLASDPPTDTWDADGWSGRGAYQRRVLGLATTLTLQADRLTGDVTRHDIDGVITRVRETRMGAILEMRWRTEVPRWDVGVTLGLDRTRRQLRDFLVRVESDLDLWRPHGAAALMWTRHSTSVLAALGVAASGAYATLPNPASMGPLYQQYVAPALSRDATRSLTLAASVGGRHRVTELLAFQVVGAWEGVGVRGTAAPYAPSGRYDRWSVEAGVVVGR